MKLKNLILTGLLATAAYKLYQNRNQIATEIADTTAIIKQGQTSLIQTKNQLAQLQSQLPKVQKTKGQLAYKVRVFKEESQPQITALSEIISQHKKKQYIF